LTNIDKLKEIGSAYKLAVPIEKSSKALLDKLYKLKEHGPTALGPALVVSIAMASQQTGSQVVLCTDGLANVGLGSLEDLKSDEEKEVVAKWYEDIGDYALSKGVTVNVISITDGECRLENLGKVTDTSQGTVERIDPLELQANFQGILKKELLATNVQATIFLHPCLRFKKDNEELQKNELQKAHQNELNELFTASSLDKDTTQKNNNTNNNATVTNDKQNDDNKK